MQPRLARLIANAAITPAVREPAMAKNSAVTTLWFSAKRRMNVAVPMTTSAAAPKDAAIPPAALWPTAPPHVAKAPRQDAALGIHVFQNRAAAPTTNAQAVRHARTMSARMTTTSVLAVPIAFRAPARLPMPIVMMAIHARQVHAMATDRAHLPSVIAESRDVAAWPAMRVTPQFATRVRAVAMRNTIAPCRDAARPPICASSRSATQT